MTAEIAPEDKPLAMFREDLRFYPGPREPDGSPTYSLFDPIKGQYYRITWTEHQIFLWLRPGITLSELIKEIEAHSTLKVTKEEIAKFFTDALNYNLLKVPHTSESIKKTADKQKQGILMWLLYHYLYIRIPILNPDPFLRRTLHYVRPLVSSTAFYIYTIIILSGFFQLITRFDEFIHTFSYFFTVPGFIAYAVGISCVKIIHEFAHAYTARYYRLFVPTMGIALIIFWPVLYTDVTDGWKLAKRSQRLAISWAGIIAELVLAGISTLGWAMTSPGVLQSVFFIVSSVTWVSTLAVNLNPALRFDGYYILCDLWGVDNLQARAFATTRWQLRKWLLGIEVDPPEENLSFRRKVGMMVYSFYTWTYRLFLYTAIALLVYHQFTKALGVFLFIMEIAIFIIWPLTWEAEQLYKLRSFMHINRRSVTTVTLLTLLMCWLIIPLPHKEYFPSIVVPTPDSSQVIYVPHSSTIKALYVKRGDLIKKGQVIAQLSSPELDVEVAKSEVELLMADQEILETSQLPELRSQMGEKKANVAALSEKIAALKKLQRQLNIVAEVSGMVYHWDETLKLGQAVGQDQVLGRIGNLDSLMVVAFISETKVADVHPGQEAFFRRKYDLTRFPGKIEKINPVRNVNLAYSQLASINHGELAVADVAAIKKEEKEKMREEPLRLIDSYFNAYLALDKTKKESQVAPLSIGETGDTEVRGPWRSMLMTLWRDIQSIFWREGSI